MKYENLPNGSDKYKKRNEFIGKTVYLDVHNKLGCGFLSGYVYYGDGDFDCIYCMKVKYL